MLGIAAVMSHIICHCVGRLVETTLLKSHLNHIRWTTGTGINHRIITLWQCGQDNNRYTLANSIVYLDKLDVIANKVVYEKFS